MEKNIHCNNYFCGYWKDFYCLLDQVELDSCGNCMNCCLIDINDDLLESLRVDSLKKWGDFFLYAK